MFLVDKLLLSPVYATAWVARQVQAAAQQEQEAEPARITAELSELYMMLESGRITEAQFDAREKGLLDQLDQLEAEAAHNQQEAALAVAAKLAPPRAAPARRSSSPARRKTVPVEAGPAPAGPLAAPLRTEIGEEEGLGQLVADKHGKLKLAAIIMVPMLIGWPAAFGGDSAKLARRLSQQRWAALAMIETGCGSERTCRADRSVGPSGEVSRYQILPALWRAHQRPRAGGRRPAQLPFHNPVAAKSVAERIMDARVAEFVRARRLAPNDFEWYILWHRPGAFAQTGYRAPRLSSVVKDRAQRFSNLRLSMGRLANTRGP